MQLTKISRSKSFEMVNGFGLKSWEKFAIEGELADKEDPLNAYVELGKVIDEAFKEAHPKAIEQPKEIQVKQKVAPLDNMVTAITTCTTIDTLKTFEKLAKSKPEFQEAYDNRLKELTNV
jgi:hypothetical protein